MLELSNIVSDLKSKRTCDTHEACQDHDESTSQITNVSENSMPGNTAAYNVAKQRARYICQMILVW